jgi:UDP-N-acetyl-D-mannosaminuronic acid dehydrogenase
MKKICVVGLGYIGLPTASLLANRGYEVIGVDVNKNTVEIINQGKIHIVEPDLDTFVQSAVQSGRLRAYLEPKEADIFMICVPTPFYEDRDIPTPNLDFVVSATEAIAPYIKEGNIVILESTSPVGSTELVTKTLKESGVDIEKLSIAYCPERVLPGKIMFELTENDRIIGGINQESALEVKKFYQTFVNGDLLLTDSKTAEMSKLVENSYRDVNIAFANELSILSDKLDINVWELIRLANRHPRVNILQPSSGVGGHCIAVDPWFIVSQDPKNAKIIKTAREVNNYKTEWCIEKVKSEALAFELKNSKKAKVALMGLAFKPNIDDLRESPALFIVESLIDNLDCLVVEPNVTNYKKFELIEYQDAISQADIVVFLVAHKEFKDIDTSDKVVVDFCGITNRGV